MRAVRGPFFVPTRALAELVAGRDDEARFAVALLAYGVEEVAGDRETRLAAAAALRIGFAIAAGAPPLRTAQIAEIDARNAAGSELRLARPIGARVVVQAAQQFQRFIHAADLEQERSPLVVRNCCGSCAPMDRKISSASSTSVSARLSSDRCCRPQAAASAPCPSMNRSPTARARRGTLRRATWVARSWRAASSKRPSSANPRYWRSPIDEQRELRGASAG